MPAVARRIGYDWGELSGRSGSTTRRPLLPPPSPFAIWLFVPHVLGGVDLLSRTKRGVRARREFVEACTRSMSANESVIAPYCGRHGQWVRNEMDPTARNAETMAANTSAPVVLNEAGGGAAARTCATVRCSILVQFSVHPALLTLLPAPIWPVFRCLDALESRPTAAEATGVARRVSFSSRRPRRTHRE